MRDDVAVNKAGKRRVGPLAALGAALLAIVGLAVFASSRRAPWLGSPIERAQRAYERGAWSDALSLARRQLQLEPGSIPARRWEARALARLGQRREAIARDASLGAEQLEAEDLYQAGQALIAEDRPALGWAALDAAARLDPAHRDAAAALASLPGRFPGPSTTALQAERLTAVADGPALAELVVGLADIASSERSAARFNTLFDRLMSRPRGDLLAVDSPSAARKLLARLLLEDGRAAEARGWLERVRPETDPEAWWLFSRAFLVEGQVARASAALDRAGRFGEDDALALEPARYVGARACAECHQGIYQAQQNSPHAQTFRTGAALATVPLPTGDVKDPLAPDIVHRFHRQGARIEESAEQKQKGRLAKALIEYALGSGRHGVTMLGKTPAGPHRQLRISYYTGGPAWDATSPFAEPPHTADDLIGGALTEQDFRACLNCHTTRFRSEHDRNGPEARDRGIGCERCHGPGDHHLRAVAASFSQLAIARPRVASPAQRMTLCAQCHAANGEIPPSDPRFTRFHSTTLAYSRCLIESGGRLDCVGCHNPHKAVETRAAHYEARCLRCHGAGSSRAEALAADERVAARACPVNQAAGCIGCHMPKVPNVMPFTSVTDHHIRVHKDAGPSIK